MWVIYGVSALCSALYSFTLFRAAYALFRLPALASVEPREPDVFPRLSVVIPACNEAHTLKHAITTLLEQDYPDLEIVLVNDRSSDGTGALADELAKSDARVRAVHIEELPPGWLGKVHALHVGVRNATGPWLLLTDADVHHAPGLLKKTVSLALERGLAQLPLVPELRAGGFLNEIAVDGFHLMLLANVNMTKIMDPDSDAFIGGGAFNLVNKHELERAGGFEWLRLEIADDMGVGLMIKRARGKVGFWLATRELRVLWYPSLGEMVHGLEKNLFAIAGHFNPVLAVARGSAMLLVAAGVMLAPFGPPWLAALGFASLLATLAFALAQRFCLSQRLLPALFLPLGLGLIAYMLLRSTWHCRRRGAVVWRGTRYELSDLRELQRVKL